MKKLSFCVMAAFVLLSFIPFQLKAESEKSASTVVTTKTIESTDANATVATKTAESTNSTSAATISENARAEAQLARLEEIKAMDLSTLTPAEKKELREEVRSIKNEQEFRDRDHDRRHGDYDEGNHHHHGMYFGIGGGVLVIILLILLLG